MAIAAGKYHIWTVGCQMNMADSQRVAAIMGDLGWEDVPTMAEANLVILNTCSVRASPEVKAHGQLSLLKYAKKQRADLLVAMMGCMIGNQRTIDDLAKRYPQVDLFFKVEQADILPNFLEERWTPIATGDGCVDVAEVGAAQAVSMERSGSVLPVINGTLLPMSITPKPATRELHYPTQLAPLEKPTAWLPVVLGCNKVCSYCIVPSRRGRERSRPVEELLAETTSLVARGAREITLLGQTVEAYGLDLPDQPSLSHLMARLSEIDGLRRIRFMTSYPRHFTDAMIHEMAALPKVCEHVNIPVQHGDDGMLTRMRRGYTLLEYRTLIDKLRAWWPGVTLSTDVIVGFCGETEDEFAHLLDLLREIRFDIVHVAMYSPRPGTLSYKWEDDVPLEVKKARLHAVEDVQQAIALELNSAIVGTTQSVLLEERQESGERLLWKGRTRSNKLAFFPIIDDGAQPGDERDVLIERTSAWSMQGTLA
ncbi:MAG: MiaB/RimO family radical SAM methylthiotransferase [Ktedonobacterales bacterium]|nr:MiaB/RimO family radical SAM methylthiotransferase [Ktedonobacterales bacterium]